MTATEPLSEAFVPPLTERIPEEPGFATMPVGELERAARRGATSFIVYVLLCRHASVREYPSIQQLVREGPPNLSPASVAHALKMLHFERLLQDREVAEIFHKSNWPA